MNKSKHSSDRILKIITPIISFLLVLTLTLSIVLPIVLKKPKKYNHFEIPSLNIPEEDRYALTKLKYNELGDMQATVRADSMNVTKRNLPRTEPEMLSDNFSLVYNETSNSLYPVYDSYTAKSGEHVASISFNPDNYPEPYYRKGSATTGVYTAAAQAAGVSEADYFAYYKYMYMSQGQHLAHEAARRSALTASNNSGIDADFAAWLKKHPSADGQYGAVKGTNNAVEKEIVLDPIYRSYHTTGLYLPAGEPVTIKIEGLKPGESIGIVLGTNNTLAWRGSVSQAALNSTGKNYTTINYLNNTSDYFFKQADLVTTYGKFFDYNNAASSTFLQAQWKRQNSRAPWTSCDFKFTENKTYTFGFAFGGLIQISMNQCISQVKATITGAVETPHYILGVTSPEYFDTYLKNAPGVIAALDTENGILTGPTGELDNPYCANMRTVKKEEIDPLAMLWHSFLSVNETFTGGTYNRHNKVMFDWHVPAGAAVSLGNYSFAMPTGWFGAAMNYQGLLKTGTWGTLHEIGHNHASAYGQTWGFGDPREGEVRNNALTLLSYIMFCDVGTTIRMGGSAEHGAYANPYNTLTETLALSKHTHTDIGDGSYGYFQFLGMYANIMHSFSAEKFYELLYTYKQKASYTSNKRADFAYRCSLVYKMNFLNYFNNFYSANITEEMFTEQQLKEMKKLPTYNPVACYYAGGIDGIKTAGDFVVNYGDEITFDLKTNTISTLDQGDTKGFVIQSVGDPIHGSLRSLGDCKYAYSFNKKYTGNTDQFSFKVKLNDGVVHEFTIYLRINNYNTSRISSYTNVEWPNTTKGNEIFDSLNNQISSKVPKIVTTNTGSPVGANLPTYNSSSLEVRTLDFYWKAPVSGEVALMVGGSTVRLYTGTDFNSMQGTDLVFTTRSINPNNYLNNAKFKYVMRVEEGNYYPIRIMSYSKGANASGAVYVLTKDNKVLVDSHLDDAKFTEFVQAGARWAQISTNEVFHPDMQQNKTYSSYVFEPNFMVSKKDSVNLSVVGTDKTQWSVIKAPELIHEGFAYNEATGVADEKTRGHYTKQVQYLYPAEAYDENGNLKPGYEDKRIEYTEYINMWKYLIDGENGTSLHTAYKGSFTPLSERNPHEFIIDTKKLQMMNYFSVTTRNNANSYIEQFDLYLADTKNVDGSYNWRKIASGDRKNYVGTTITVKFNEQNARYLRLVVKKTSGGSFSVLSEIDAGIKAQTQKLISSSTSKLYTTKGWVSSSKIDSEPNGYLITNKKNQKVVIRFVGEGISLYAATDKDFGNITIKMDGKKVANVDLDSDQHALRKLVYFTDDLENKEHTMEIITNNSGKVMLSVIGLPYSASLLNAPNIYLEKALIISLVVFIALFVVLLALLICLLFIPKFRHFMGNNRAIAWLDRKLEESKEKRKAKKQAKKEEKQFKKDVEAATNKDKSNKTEKNAKNVQNAKKPNLVQKTTTKSSTKQSENKGNKTKKK